MIKYTRVNESHTLCSWLVTPDEFLYFDDRICDEVKKA